MAFLDEERVRVETLETNQASMPTSLTGKEVTANKATNFSTVNDTLYPTVKAVKDEIATAVVGLLDYRGSYDASTNLFPATGGSGIAGAVLKGDFWIASVAGTLGGVAVTAGDLIIALVDTPAQVSSNWDTIDHDVSGGGSISDGDYGDIVVSGGGTVWTIDGAVLSGFQTTTEKNEEGGYAGLATTGGALKLFDNGGGQPFYQTDRIHKRLVDPTADDDSINGFLEDDVSINKSTGGIFVCTDPTDTAAVWYQIGGVIRVVHGSTASTPRPNTAHVEWVGSVEPTNATDNDTWYQI